mmetsp:Transcript_15059/g.31971  ORF Transcript_15059/g.31971 Transcript_15059/m.31971 type:complete len:449 (+) Transcript_15059:249-1595(+)
MSTSNVDSPTLNPHPPTSTMREQGDNNNGSDPQSPSTEEQQHQLEYNGLLTKSLPRKNCCTWKVAAVFLFFVAGALVVTWQMLPAEDIVAKYIPQFDEPAVVYSGPEAGMSDGSSWSSGGNSKDDGEGGDGGMGIDNMPTDPSEDGSVVEAGRTVPSFMQCPEGGGLCCNGNAENCMLRVDQMLFGMVHNSMSSEEGGFTFGYNQKYELERALIAGYRGLNLDVCNCKGVIQFCHNICDLGERIPEEVFSNTLEFLNEYPSEVVVLLFQASTETGITVWNDLHSEMKNVDGFADMIYTHTFGGEWPTMGDLVQQNKRIIVFYFNGGTCYDEGCPPTFNYFYNYAAETQYESASLADLENFEYSCKITRKPKENWLPPVFLVVNNFVTPPDEDVAAETNSRTFLADRLTACGNMNRMRPNFVYLDFWNQGATAELVQYANAKFAQQLGR